MSPAASTPSVPTLAPLADAPPRPFPAAVGEMTVRGVQAVTPRTTRVTFVADALRALPCEQAGEIITLVWPAPGREELLLPPVGRWAFPPEAEGQHTRNYTVRRHDAGAGELDVDFVLHGDEGRCSAWAARAAPGQRLGFAGPRTHWTAEPAAAWSLLVADETGLPALAAQLERLPEGHRALAVVEVHDDGERQALPARDGLEIVWVAREGAAAGPSDRVADAVRALDLPDGPGQVWGGLEAGSARAVRDHVRQERGLRGPAVRILGYWKHRVTPTYDG